jgi:FdhD protein
MAVQVYKGVRYRGNRSNPVNDELTVEEAIQIRINGHPYTVTMRTPGDLQELVRGLLFTEDIYTGKTSLEMKVEKVNDHGVVLSVDVTIPEKQLGPGYLNERNILSVSSCGICGKRELDDLTVRGEKINSDLRMDASLIESMFKTMNQHQATFNRSGGSHAAAAFDKNENLLAVKEDIGRHNAVDKVIGGLLEANQLEEAAVLLVSGRISYEIVTKCFVAGIPFLASVSAPSSLAVEYAESLGITLLAFCRGENCTVYANAERVK